MDHPNFTPTRPVHPHRDDGSLDNALWQPPSAVNGAISAAAQQWGSATSNAKRVVPAVVIGVAVVALVVGMNYKFKHKDHVTTLAQGQAVETVIDEAPPAAGPAPTPAPEPSAVAAPPPEAAPPQTTEALTAPVSKPRVEAPAPRVEAPAPRVPTPPPPRAVVRKEEASTAPAVPPAAMPSVPAAPAIQPESGAIPAPAMPPAAQPDTAPQTPPTTPATQPEPAPSN
ncbi:hypothetical protein AACH06_05590 [Ideonella sp. DXS29W]|uniref:Uncharacterized protein n=1 Tax=Ideonella lacteola TaxID=2984193 RepID=A0ABU9BNR3_9BURK